MSADTDPTRTSEKRAAPASVGPPPPIARLSRVRELGVVALAILLYFVVLLDLQSSIDSLAGCAPHSSD